jgi:aminocarboxymuconate-semialdehyde decarboxylase
MIGEGGLMTIDMQAHFIPPKILSVLEQEPSRYGVRLAEAAGGGRCVHFDQGPQLRPFQPLLFDLDARWDTMAREGIERQILSTWTDLFGYSMPAEAGARWHRLLNESLCEVVQRHADRLSALTSAPLQDAQRAARELEYGIKQCGAVGGVIAANVDDTNLGEAPLDEFWAAAVELDVPLFIHPTQPLLPPRTRQHGMLQVVQFIYDTTATVGSLIFNGVLDRFPTLNLILSHGGGFFPYQIGRFDRVYRNLEAPTVPSQPPSGYRRRFFYDTILYHPSALQFLQHLVGSDRLLLGTDYPFPVDEQAPLTLLAQAGCTADEILQIGGGTAQRLFKL